jgi:hypothetical protein
MALSAGPPEVLRDLVAMAVKERVGLGGLSAAHRAGALALVWAGLPAHAALTERQVNEVLKAQLAGAAAFLGTDHVELRRWLVDTGWLARDGYGREYRRVAPASLPPAQQALAAALAGIDAAAWVAGLRRSRQAQRDARRSEWQAARGAAP